MLFAMGGFGIHASGEVMGRWGGALPFGVATAATQRKRGAANLYL